MARSSIIVDPRNLHIRPGEPADSPALRQIFLRARSLSWTWLPAAAWRLEDFDAATADEQLWVAECDGQPVGFAAVWTADNFLHHLFVDPDWQGKHIGSALLAQVERTFTASGTLKCLMENKNALRFYQRHGWTIEAQGASPEGRYWHNALAAALNGAEGNLTRDHFSLPVHLGRHPARQLAVDVGKFAVRTRHHRRRAVI